MSPHATKTAPKPKPMSATQRKTLATRIITDALELEASPNQTALTTAVFELVSEWLALDPSARSSLQEKYTELASVGTKGTQESVVGTMPSLLPGRGRGLDNYNPYAKLDPYELLEDYGVSQLRAVLERKSQSALREAVASVQTRNPKTKPKSKSKNTDMIDYIVEHVAGPGY